MQQEFPKFECGMSKKDRGLNLQFLHLYITLLIFDVQCGTRLCVLLLLKDPQSRLQLSMTDLLSTVRMKLIGVESPRLSTHIATGHKLRSE